MKIIGQGGFGCVCLVNYKPAGRTYAMKYVKQGKHDECQMARLEVKLLNKVNHPFVCNLLCAFSLHNGEIIVMDAVMGGELYDLIQKRGPFNDADAGFYLVQIAIALEYLHSQDIVYRDLKSENILVSEIDGYIKLIDFGLAKVTKINTFTMCGTPLYGEVSHCVSCYYLTVPCAQPPVGTRQAHLRSTTAQATTRV